MSDKSFKDALKKIAEIGSVVSKLPAEIRGSAFAILSEYAFDAVPDVVMDAQKDKKAPIGAKKGAGNLSLESFFSEHGSNDPSEN